MKERGRQRREPCQAETYLIPLSGARGYGKSVIVDADDYPQVAVYKWFLSGNGYAVSNNQVNGKRRYVIMHRFIAKTPQGKQTDHINHNRLDNRKRNLRTVTTQQNQCNRLSKPGSSSRFKGVFWWSSRNKWVASIKTNGKSIHLGVFFDEKLAAEAYNRAAKRYQGEYAVINQV